jgi:hypothetical protein
MIKKLTMPILVALMLAAALSGVASAAEGIGQRQVNYGEVVGLGDDNFTVQTRRSGELTYLVMESTRFRAPQIDEPGFGDLQVGGKVLVFSWAASQEALTARLVVLLPEDFDPAAWAATRARGQVTAVDVPAGSFSLETPAGEVKTFFVNDQTRFLGQPSSLEDLQVGWRAAVGGEEMEDGSLLAKIVLAGDAERPRLRAGTVTGVTPAAGTFTLLTRNGDELVFAVDDSTQFHSRTGEIEGLADLVPDMVALVSGIPGGEGVWAAKHVAAGEAEDLPDYDQKIRGRVTRVGGSAFSVSTPNQDEWTFQVSEETRFWGRGGEVQTLDDLEAGQLVWVGAHESASGELLAKLVFVLARQTP